MTSPEAIPDAIETGYALLARELVEAGLGTLSGVMGEANLDLIACLADRYAIRYVAARHEAGAVAMADGFARASGAIGFATVTCGPGLTNAITPLVTAVRAHAEMLLVTGQLPLDATGRSQLIDHVALLAPTGAGIVHVAAAAELPGAVAGALRMVRESRRPVVLNVLMPVLDGPCPSSGDLRTAGAARPSPAPACEAVSRRDMERAAALLAAAARPVLLVGRGAVEAGAGDAIRGLGRRLGAGLATTLLAHGLFSGEGHDLGVAGGLSNAEGQRALEGADVVAAFGASLNGWTTRAGTTGRDATVIQVDRDPDAFGRSTLPVDLGIVGDVSAVVAGLHAELDRGAARSTGSRPGAPSPGSVADAPDSTSPRWGEGLPARLDAPLPHKPGLPDLRHFSCRTRQQPSSVGERSSAAERRPGEGATPTEHGTSLDPRALCRALDAALPRARTVTVDAGQFFEFPTKYMSVPDERGYLFTIAFGTVGLGLATATGAAFARPDRLSVAFVGDGGLMMSLSDLDAIARYRVPMLVVVMNDGAYGAEIKHLEDRGWNPDLARFANPSFAALAQALGIEGRTVESLDDVAAIAGELARMEGPMLIDARVDPAVRAEWMAVMHAARQP